MQPKLTISGYRGVWGETLTPEIARDFIQAFAQFIHKNDGTKILVGRDARTSGPELTEIVIEALLDAGLDVVDLGMIPTPTVLFLIKNQGAHGGVIITASHNPIEYNGLKFATQTGSFTTESEVREIESFKGQNFSSQTKGVRTDGSTLFDTYLSTLLTHIDTDAIRARGFKVAIDPINSVGCTTTPKLLSALGATYTAINAEPTGVFAHEPEPIAKNLTDLQELVRSSGSDIGFAQDPDGDRLVLCDETGTLLSEEMTLPLCLKVILSKTPGDIVINLSTSNMSEDIATSFGSKTFRSKVGEGNVVSAIRDHNAIVGGEGSSGAIWPTVNATRDSFVCMSLILELMAKESKPLSEIVKSIKTYPMIKEKFTFDGDLPTVYRNIVSGVTGASTNALDGLRLDFPDRSWAHIRPSNTEPIIRVFAEAETEERAKELIQLTKIYIVS